MEGVKGKHLRIVGKAAGNLLESNEVVESKVLIDKM
jgi:hypothetical protein